MATAEGDSLLRVPIRYDGGDAERHQIELSLLGESLSGIARVIAVVGHFSVTLEYAKQYQAHDVKVLVEEPVANCYSLSAVMEWAKDLQLFSGTIGTLFGALLTWVIGRAAGRKEEMKALKDSLDRAIYEMARGNQQTLDRALSTVDRIAESLRPAVRQAVAPVGRTCKSMTIASSAFVDEAMAEAIRSIEADEVTEEKSWRVVFTELDIETGSAKIRWADDAQADGRVKAKITDPAFDARPNVYTLSLSEGAELLVRGKATLRDGDVSCLYISDAKLAT